MKHENLENYFSSKVPSLKEFYSLKINGDSKFSSIRLLANVAQFLQRWAFILMTCVHMLAFDVIPYDEGCAFCSPNFFHKCAKFLFIYFLCKLSWFTILLLFVVWFLEHLTFFFLIKLIVAWAMKLWIFLVREEYPY